VTEKSINRHRARRTLLIAGACHLVHDGYTDVLYVMLPLWAIAFDLTLTQIGWLLTANLLVMGIGQLPMGLLGERFGERIPLVLGTLLTGMAFVALSTVNTYWTLLIALVVAGLGSGVQHPLSSSLVARAHPASGRKLALATYNFTGDLGKMAFPFLAASLIGVWSWRSTSLTLGVIGIGTALMVGCVLQCLKTGGSSRKATRKATQLTDWGIHEPFAFSVLTSIYVLDMLVRAGFLMLLPFCLINNSLPDEKVGYALSALFVGGAAGKYLIGRLTQWLGVMFAVILSEGLTCFGILTVLILPLDLTLWALPVIGAALNGTSSALYGSVTDFVNDNRRARAFGLFYTLGIAASALAPLLSGLMSDHMGLNTAVVAVALGAILTMPLACMLRPALRRARIVMLRANAIETKGDDSKTAPF